MLIMLSVFLMPICIGASWVAIEKRVQEYMCAFLVTEMLMIGTFAAQDLFLFYIFFEAGLIPMYLIIGIWGGREPHLRELQILPLHAARFGRDAHRDAVDGAICGHDQHPAAAQHRFPGAGADLAMAGLLRLVRGEDADVAVPHLAARRARPGADRWVGDPGGRVAEARRLRFPALLAADVPGSLGAVGWLVFGLSAVAVIYTSLVALVQSDMKKLIAYSSVAHMAIVTIGLFAFNRQGIEGAMMVMLGHGLVSARACSCASA